MVQLKMLNKNEARESGRSGRAVSPSFSQGRRKNPCKQSRRSEKATAPKVDDKHQPRFSDIYIRALHLLTQLQTVHNDRLIPILHWHWPPPPHARVRCSSPLIMGHQLTSPRGYSALEFSQLSAHSHRTPSAAVPLDIQIETVIAVVLVCLGLVAGAERLKPIAWNVWAGKIEREGGAANPYLVLEERPGFLDIKVSFQLLCRNSRLRLSRS